MPSYQKQPLGVELTVNEPFPPALGKVRLGGLIENVQSVLFWVKLSVTGTPPEVTII
jgi:hypothetical protein